MEDISGWLFDNNEIDLIKRFIVIQGSQSEDSFSNYYYRAVWKFDDVGQLSIDFIKYDVLVLSNSVIPDCS